MLGRSKTSRYICFNLVLWCWIYNHVIDMCDVQKNHYPMFPAILFIQSYLYSFRDLFCVILRTALDSHEPVLASGQDGFGDVPGTPSLSYNQQK